MIYFLDSYTTLLFQSCLTLSDLTVSSVGVRMYTLAPQPESESLSKADNKLFDITSKSCSGSKSGL